MKNTDNQKKREYLLSQPYLTKTELQVLFNLPYRPSINLYKKADSIDNEELKDFRCDPNRVRLKTAIRVSGYSPEELEKIIKKNA